MPELPDIKAGSSSRTTPYPADAQVLTADKRLTNFYESVRLYGDAKTVSNWLMGDVLGELHSKGARAGRDESLSTFVNMLV